MVNRKYVKYDGDNDNDTVATLKMLVMMYLCNRGQSCQSTYGLADRLLMFLTCVYEVVIRLWSVGTWVLPQCP